MPHAEEIGQDRERASARTFQQVACLAHSLLLFFLTVIMFIARQALSVMAPVLRTVFHLSNTAYGRIVSALGFGMMSAEFPMGYLMDRLGARLRFHGGRGMVVGCDRIVCARGLRRAFAGPFAILERNWRMRRVFRWSQDGPRLFEKKDRTLAIGIFNGGSVIGATLRPRDRLSPEHYGFRRSRFWSHGGRFPLDSTWWFVYRRSRRTQQILPAHGFRGDAAATPPHGR